jgi:hypothetical protein
MTIVKPPASRDRRAAPRIQVTAAALALALSLVSARRHARKERR